MRKGFHGRNDTSMLALKSGDKTVSVPTWAWLRSLKVRQESGLWNVGGVLLRNDIGSVPQDVEPLEKLMRGIDLDGINHSKIEVIIGETQGVFTANYRNEKEKEIKKQVEKKQGVHEVMVDLDKVPWSENDVKRRQVAAMIGLMEMKRGLPIVKVMITPEFGLMMELKRNGIEKLARVADFMKAMPEISSMGKGPEQHWGLDKLAVDESSSPAEWQKFIDSIKIKGRVQRQPKKA